MMYGVDFLILYDLPSLYFYNACKCLRQRYCKVNCRFLIFMLKSIYNIINIVHYEEQPIDMID